MTRSLLLRGRSRGRGLLGSRTRRLDGTGRDDHGDVARALADRYARPWARGRNRLSVGPSSTYARRRTATGVQSLVVLGVGDRAGEHLVDRLARGLRCEPAAPSAPPWRAGRGRGRPRGAPSSARRARYRAAPWLHAFALRRELRRSSVGSVSWRLAPPGIATSGAALRSSFMWPLNVRVSANSPSLWPTIDSDTNTGTCLRPSCTAIVWPSMSGMIVDRRDQVLITFLVPFSFWTSTFLSRWSSTNGPFFRLRGMSDPSALLRVLRRRTISLSLGLCPCGCGPRACPSG